jgi:hypothetical protein
MTEKPEKKYSSGAISATIWSNEGTSKTGEKIKFKTITLQRSYQDKDKKWQNTNSLRLSDLPRASLVLNKAYEYLTLKEDSQTIDNDIIEIEDL